MRDDHDQFAGRGVTVLPISVDHTYSLKEYKAKYNMQVDMLSDFQRDVSRLVRRAARGPLLLQARVLPDRRRRRDPLGARRRRTRATAVRTPRSSRRSIACRAAAGRGGTGALRTGAPARLTRAIGHLVRSPLRSTTSCPRLLLSASARHRPLEADSANAHRDRRDRRRARDRRFGRRGHAGHPRRRRQRAGRRAGEPLAARPRRLAARVGRRERRDRRVRASRNSFARDDGPRARRRSSSPGCSPAARSSAPCRRGRAGRCPARTSSFSPRSPTCSRPRFATPSTRIASSPRSRRARARSTSSGGSPRRSSTRCRSAST